MIYLICPTRALFLTGGHSNQDHRCTQKPTYTPIFTHNIRSSLLRTRKSIYLPSTMYQVYINSGKRGERQEIYDTWYNLSVAGNGEWRNIESPAEIEKLRTKLQSYPQHAHPLNGTMKMKKKRRRENMPPCLSKKANDRAQKLTSCFVFSSIPVSYTHLTLPTKA